MFWRYKVSFSLSSLWNELFDEHDIAKHTVFSVKLKQQTLDIIIWKQYLVDRMNIFDCLERRMESSTLDNRPSSILNEYPTRSGLIMESWKEGERMIPLSNRARKVISLIEKCEDWELECHVFIHYGELWFGGAVHARWIERIIKHNNTWREYYFPGSNDDLFSKPLRFSSFNTRLETTSYQSLSKITSWFQFGEFTEQKSLITQYFAMFDRFLSLPDNQEKIGDIISVCRHSMNSLSHLANADS